MTQRKLQRIMLVSKHFDEHDFSHHFRRIANLCDEQGCQLLVYSLCSYGNGGGQWYPPRHLLFGNSKKLEMVVLETCDWEIGEPYTVEVHSRDKRKPDVFVRKFARGSDSDNLKRSLVTEFKSRVYTSTFDNRVVGHLICGEINALKVRHDGRKRASDPFRLKEAIAKNRVQVLLNGWHTAARRFEINVKRAELSRPRIWYVSVWNKRKGPEPERPWCAYYGGKNVTDKIKELPGPVIPVRKDIRIGVLELPAR